MGTTPFFLIVFAFEFNYLFDDVSKALKITLIKFTDIK